MRARTSLGCGIQKLPPRTDAGREAVRGLADHDRRRYGNMASMVDFSELELRVLAELGISAEDLFRA